MAPPPPAISSDSVTKTMMPPGVLPTVEKQLSSHSSGSEAVGQDSSSGKISVSDAELTIVGAPCLASKGARPTFIPVSDVIQEDEAKMREALGNIGEQLETPSTELVLDKEVTVLVLEKETTKPAEQLQRENFRMLKTRPSNTLWSSVVQNKLCLSKHELTVSVPDVGPLVIEIPDDVFHREVP